MDVLRKAFDDGLVDPGFIDIETIEKMLEDGLDACMAVFGRRSKAELDKTPHDVLSHWACFDSAGVDRGEKFDIELAPGSDEGGDQRVHTKGPNTDAQKKREQKREQKRKQKRKQAKAARRKGRGKKKRKR